MTVAASPSGATQPLVDSLGATWSINDAGHVVHGGVVDTTTNSVTQLLYFNGVIYQFSTVATYGGWYGWIGGKWTLQTQDPRLPPPVVVVPPPPPVSKSPLASAAALLAYITALPSATKRVLIGQHSSYWNANPMDYITQDTTNTGKTVAIAGFTSFDEGSTENCVTLANAWLAKGGIPLVSWWPLDPFTNAADNDRAINFADLLNSGSAAYAAWYKLLDAQIATLKAINGPVLYRPFVEMDGNWSWWGAQTPATMVLVQQQMHAYFVAKGVTNALWVYNVNAWSGNYTQYFPGAAYADIVSWDAYPPQSNDPTYAALVGLGKPIILAEAGVISANNSAVAPQAGDNSALLATVKTSFPKVVAVVLWCQNYALPEQKGEKAVMTDPAVVTLSDLPS